MVLGENNMYQKLGIALHDGYEAVHGFDIEPDPHQKKRCYHCDVFRTKGESHVMAVNESWNHYLIAMPESGWGWRSSQLHAHMTCMGMPEYTRFYSVCFRHAREVKRGCLITN